MGIVSKRVVLPVALLLGVFQAHSQTLYEFRYSGSFSDGISSGSHQFRAFVSGIESGGVVTVTDVANLWFDNSIIWPAFEFGSAADPAQAGTLALDGSSLDLYGVDELGTNQFVLSTASSAFSVSIDGTTYTASWPLTLSGWRMGEAPLSETGPSTGGGSPSAVPEPSAALLALLGLPVVAWRRKKAATV